MLKHIFSIICVFVLGISGCVSVEELARQDLGTTAEHKRIFVECKSKREAFREWFRQRETPMNAHEVGPRAVKVYTDCLEKNHPGLMFLDQTTTTSLDIYSKNMLRFRTGGDFLIERYFENSRKWHRALHKGKQPWDGYGREYLEALEGWQKFFRGAN